MQKLASGRWSELFRTAACKRFEVPCFEPQWNGKIHAVERLGVSDRRLLMALVAHLLADWPATFLAVINHAGLTASALLDYEADPYWYSSVIRSELSAAKHVPDEAEILSVMRYLRKCGTPVTKTSVGRLLGNIGWYRKRKLTPPLRAALQGYS